MKFGEGVSTLSVDSSIIIFNMWLVIVFSSFRLYKLASDLAPRKASVSAATTHNLDLVATDRVIPGPRVTPSRLKTLPAVTLGTLRVQPPPLCRIHKYENFKNFS